MNTNINRWYRIRWKVWNRIWMTIFGKVVNWLLFQWLGIRLEMPLVWHMHLKSFAFSFRISNSVILKVERSIVNRFHEWYEYKWWLSLISIVLRNDLGKNKILLIFTRRIVGIYFFSSMRTFNDIKLARTLELLCAYKCISIMHIVHVLTWTFSITAKYFSFKYVTAFVVDIESSISI